MKTFVEVNYDLFNEVVLHNTPAAKLTKLYGLTETQIRKIVHKDSTVTEEQYLNWCKLPKELT